MFGVAYVVQTIVKTIDFVDVRVPQSVRRSMHVAIFVFHMCPVAFHGVRVNAPVVWINELDTMIYNCMVEKGAAGPPAINNDAGPGKTVSIDDGHQRQGRLVRNWH